MKFEWDENKNAENVRKHHIDFADGGRVFDGPMQVSVDDRSFYDESRSIGIGMLFGLIVVVVFVEPDDDTIRIISIRRAVKYERERYAKFLEDQFGSFEENE